VLYPFDDVHTLVLDLGSSSTRALIYDAHARLADGLLAREVCEFTTSADGASEDDAVAAWLRSRRLIDQLRERLPASVAIQAVAPSAYVTSLLCLDARGQPISPVLTYADTRASDDAAALRAEHSELHAHARTGCRIRANYWPARLRWLARTRPALFAQTRWFVSLSDFIDMRLTGALSPRSSLSAASWTGLLNRAALTWDADWLAALGLSADRLPALDESPHAAHPQLRLGDAAVFPAIGDGAAANIGSGCVDARSLAVTIGTTAAARIVTPHGPAALSGALWQYRVDGARALLGGATTEGGGVVAWATEALKLDLAAASARFADTPPDVHGLTVLPTFAGERSPGYAEHASGVIHGLRLATRPEDILRALIESISYRIAQIVDALGPLAAPDAPIIASGGALVVSQYWRQLLADVTGRDVWLTDEAEASARGAAMLALSRSGVAALTDLAPRRWLAHRPDASRYAIYRAAMARQQAMYARLIQPDSD
jgi:gluconokinase